MDIIPRIGPAGAVFGKAACDHRRMRTRRAWSIGVAAVVAALAAPAAVACVATGDGVPPEFEERSRLTGCGTLDHVKVGATPPAGPEACLYRAMRDGTGAELVVNGMSDEGSPWVTHYRAVPGRPGLESFHESTESDFGPGGWSYRTCPAATNLSALGDCDIREF